VETVETVLADHEEVYSYEVIPSDDSRFYVFAHVEEEERLSEIFTIAEKYALLFNRPISITDNGVAVTVIGTSESLQTAFTDVTERTPFSIEWVGQYTPGQHDAIGWLTTRQCKTLEVAHEFGFYEMPRQASYKEIADELDCAPSTANELLRRGEQALIEGILDS
jgi:predicted DNA binding protein